MEKAQRILIYSGDQNLCSADMSGRKSHILSDLLSIAMHDRRVNQSRNIGPSNCGDLSTGALLSSPVDCESEKTLFAPKH